MCAQVAAGNVNTCFLGFEEGRSFVVSCGITPVIIEGEKEIEESIITQNTAEKFDLLSSLPYSVHIDLPVVKVMCGDQFSGLLTADG